ncbi:MAG: hypothetical protein JXA03_13635 [Bacteroidales bacterium]|nr:hypothetical protein [Bacteroidales bacterium]
MKKVDYNIADDLIKTGKNIFLCGIPLSGLLIFAIVNLNHYFINRMVWHNSTATAAVLSVLMVLMFAGYAIKQLPLRGRLLVFRHFFLLTSLF